MNKTFSSQIRRKGLKIEDELKLINLIDRKNNKNLDILEDNEDYTEIKDLFPEYPEDTHKAILLNDKAFTVNGKVITYKE